MDKELSADPTLRAVAELFAQPPQRRPAERRLPPRRREIMRRPEWLTRLPYPYALISVIGAVLSLVCCAVTAALHAPTAATVGAALAVCAGLSFVVVVVRRRAATTTVDDSFPHRSSAPAGDGAA